MIPNEEKKGWHYLAIKKEKTISIIKRDNVKTPPQFLFKLPYSFVTKNKLESPEKV